MKSVVIGAVESTRITLESLAAAGAPASLLITLPHTLAANHSDFVDLAPTAAATGTRCLRTADVNADDIIAEVAGIAPDIIFVVGWSRLVKAPLQALARTGVIGYHPTLLPLMRGRAALAWTILLDVSTTGGTLFWIDDGVDSGDIAAQREFALSGREYLGDLITMQMDALRSMLEELVPRLAEGERPARAQHHELATYLAHRRPEDGLILWDQPAETIWRQVRAVSRPYPGAFTRVDDGVMKIWRARVADHPEWHAQTGQIFMTVDDCPVVRCGDGRDLVIEELEMVRAKKPVGQKRLGRP